ncbi:MAG: acyltransferase [Archangium sp.]|nr:acyltransferase [Archangium sp.]
MKIRLSPIDLFFSGPDSRPSNMGFWFEGRLDPKLMAQSLAELAEVYFPIKGRLLEVDPTVLALGDFDTAPKLECVEVATLPLDDELKLIDLLEPASNAPGGSLVRLKLLLSERHSVLLISFSHVLGDAAAFFDFLMDWVALAAHRKVEAPSFDREVFRGIFEAMKFDPRKLNLGSMSALSKKNHGFIGEGPKPEVSRSDFLGVQRTLFPRDEVRALRQAASADGERPATVFSAIAGEAYRLKAAENQAAQLEDQETVLVCPVDLRRVLGEVPAKFFGNAIKGVSCTHATDEVLSATPRTRAEWIGASIQSVTRENLNLDFHLLDFMRKTAGFKKVQGLRASRSNSLLVTDMTFAPLRFVRFEGKTCFKVSMLSFYANTAAILEHADGHELIRAKVKRA